MRMLNENINIIICQKSMLEMWKEHLEIYYPEYQVIQYQKKNTPIPNNKKLVIIINYDLVWRRPELANLENFTLILDESSCIKNSKAKRTKFILKNLKPKNVSL